MKLAFILAIVVPVGVSAQTLEIGKYASSCALISELREKLASEEMPCKRGNLSRLEANVFQRFDRPQNSSYCVADLDEFFPEFVCLSSTSEHMGHLTCVKPIPFSEISTAKENWEIVGRELQREIRASSQCPYSNSVSDFMGMTLQSSDLNNIAKPEFGILTQIGANFITAQNVTYSFALADPWIDWNVPYQEVGLEAFAMSAYKYGHEGILDNLDSRRIEPFDDAFIQGSNHSFSSAQYLGLTEKGIENVDLYFSDIMDELPDEIANQLPLKVTSGAIIFSSEAKISQDVVPDIANICTQEFASSLDEGRTCVESAAISSLASHLHSSALFSQFEGEKFSNLPLREQQNLFNQFDMGLRTVRAELTGVISEIERADPIPFYYRSRNSTDNAEEFERDFQTMSLEIRSGLNQAQIYFQESFCAGGQRVALIAMMPLPRNSILVDWTSSASLGFMGAVISTCAGDDTKARLADLENGLYEEIEIWLQN